MADPGLAMEAWMCQNFGGDEPITVTDADGWAEYAAAVVAACPRLQFVRQADGRTCASVFATARSLWTDLKQRAVDNPARLAAWDTQAREFFSVCGQLARAPSRAAAVTPRCRGPRRSDAETAIDSTTLTLALACVWVLREVDRHHEITRGHHNVFLGNCTEPLVEAVQYICNFTTQPDNSRKKSKTPSALCAACASRVKKSPN